MQVPRSQTQCFFWLVGAALDIVNEFGETGLMNASMAGRTDVIKALILAGAALDIEDKHGGTALYFASGRGHTDSWAH